MKKPSPNSIPLTGDKVFKRDYFTPYLGEPGSPRMYPVLEVLGPGLLAYRFDPETHERTDVTVLNSAIPTLTFRIVHYYAELEIAYDSAVEFLVHRFLGVYRLSLAKERLSQLIFNRRKLVRQARMRVLQHMVDTTLRKDDYTTSSIGLLVDLYGNRSMAHPDNEQLITYYDFIFKSLEQSGDLSVSDGIYYSIRPKALTTLSDHELEERRHKDQIRQQKALAFLTAVLAIIGTWQAVATTFGSTSDEVPVGVTQQSPANMQFE